jgi:hypothetical protein
MCQKITVEQVRSAMDAWRDAKTVAVRYDPSDPSVSCLSFGLHRSIQITLAFAVTWLLFVTGFTLLYWLFSLRDDVLLDNLLVQ